MKDPKQNAYNFDGLLAAWLDALDTEELNRRFYKDSCSTWFKRARQARRNFPLTKPRLFLPEEEHVIRLITRLLFVWFIKEKRTNSASTVHSEKQIGPLLRDYDRDTRRFLFQGCAAESLFSPL